jgi:hypothetical protein
MMSAKVSRTRQRRRFFNQSFYDNAGLTEGVRSSVMPDSRAWTICQRSPGSCQESPEENAYLVLTTNSRLARWRVAWGAPKV